jgi:hypothetical protein
LHLAYWALGLQFTNFFTTMNPSICLLTLFILIRFTTQAQTNSQQLSAQYEQYKESAITQRRFKHNELVPLLENVKQTKGFEVMPVGKSIQGRTIYMVKAGTGATEVLLWSQMHGDEPTATMAL